MTSYFEPLDDDELRDHLRLTTPSTIARAGWSINEAAVLAAIDFLGIEHPVNIRFMTTKYGDTLGTHYWSRRRRQHRITVAQNLKQAGRASETLWHELTHCMQAERFSKKTGQPIEDFHEEEYRLLNGEWGLTYQGNLLEKEARKVAAERNINHQLCT